MRRWGVFINTFLVNLGIGGLIVGFLLGVTALAYFSSIFPEWVGFAADPLPPSAIPTPVVIYQQEKTLWDWLELLLVPVVLAIGGYWLTRTENRYALELQERREKDAALQGYLDQMTALLLHEKLLTSEKESPVRVVARALTLTIWALC